MNASAAYDAPLLITGCPRSGATALALCLSHHRHICILPEACVYDVRNDYLASSRPIHWEHLPFPVEASVKGGIAQFQRHRPTNHEMRTVVFDAIAARKPLRVYGDKVPQRYLQQMLEITQRFPRSRFLVTIRDGRDVVASQIRWYRRQRAAGLPVEWWMRPSVADAEEMWLKAMKTWEGARLAIPASRLLEIRYEQATADPDEMLRSVCSFAGLPYEADAFAEGARLYQPHRVGHWQREVPDMMTSLSWSFSRMLQRWGYE